MRMFDMPENADLTVLDTGIIARMLRRVMLT